MKKQDILQRFLFENLPIRGELVHLNESYQTIIHQHGYPPAIQRLLGEALVLVNLLSAIIKFEGRLTLQFQGKGRLRLLLAQCNHEFHLRGLAQWDGDDISEEELLDDLRKGTLAIMMDPDATGRRYQGIVAWRGNSLRESIEGYFENSEQLLTRIWIALDEHKAAGMLLQILPREGGRSDAFPTNDPDWEHITILTETIQPEELLTLDNKTILHRLYVEEDVRLFEPLPVMFRCTCSVKRGEDAILLLGKEEAEEELNEKQKLVVVCEFCNKEYEFDRVDVENIFRKGGMPPTSTQIH